EGRRHDAFDARCEGNDVTVKETNLRRGLGSAADEARVSPPGEEAQEIEIAELPDAQAGSDGEAFDGGARVTAMVAEILVDRSEESGEGRQKKDDAGAGRESGSDAGKQSPVVGDVLQNIEADAGIRAEVVQSGGESGIGGDVANGGGEAGVA